MATSSIVNTLGAGSGIDVKALAQGLVDAEKIPRKERIDAKIAKTEAKITGFSAITAFRPLNPGRRGRILSIVGIGTLVYLTAIALPESYLDSFNLFLQLMLYFLVPWTAVNLADFYLVRKGQYAISDIFNPAGIYGQWGKAGLVARCGHFGQDRGFLQLAGGLSRRDVPQAQEAKLLAPARRRRSIAQGIVPQCRRSRWLAWYWCWRWTGSWVSAGR